MTFLRVAKHRGEVTLCELRKHRRYGSGRKIPYGLALQLIPKGTLDTSVPDGEGGFYRVYELPEGVVETRSRIARVQREDVRLALMAAYLWAARASEVVGVASGSDTTTPYGPRGADASEQPYQPGRGEQPVRAAVFTVRTAKRGGRIRYVALPLEQKYEPWAQPLLDYFKARGQELAFPFTRQTLHSYASEAFDGLTYGIEEQLIDGAKVPAHERGAGVHFLRHLRSSELASFYGFAREPAHLAYYCGWTLKSAGMSRTMCRYLDLSWQAYFGKLLIERA